MGLDPERLPKADFKSPLTCWLNTIIVKKKNKIDKDEIKKTQYFQQN